jgi:hypothetical protein
MRASGCAGVMIGRGAMRCPWLFRRAWSLINSGDPGPDPSLREKVQVVARHLELLLHYRGEAAARRCLQQRISWYGKTMGHIKPLKEAIRLAASTGEMQDHLERWSQPRRAGLHSTPDEPSGEALAPPLSAATTIQGESGEGELARETDRTIPRQRGGTFPEDWKKSTCPPPDP